jgi:hypothetical protein
LGILRFLYLYNVALVQEFLDQTRKRISNGAEITFTKKASDELQNLMLDFDINVSDAEAAIENLSPENYFRGIDPSGGKDFNVCAFCTTVGKDKLEIYLKYGVQVAGLQILLFSNHVPDFPMNYPFKN